MKQLDSPNIVEAINLSAGYDATNIWHDATFSIKRGEFVGLLGANGAGKTTLFRLLLGLELPTQGSLTVLGETPKRGNPRIGYVPQRHSIDSDSNIASIEYVRLGTFGNKWAFALGKKAKHELSQAHKALALVDASNLANRPLGELSGGEQQRVFLAQALVGKPDLLLLDEPLASLDIRREVQLIQLINNISKSTGVSVILIAHDINPLLPVIERIIYIANSKVAAGKPEEIVTSQKLSELYEAPIEVLHSISGRLAVLGVEEAIHHD